MTERPVDDAVFERMVTVRRDLHRHPELAWQENRTAERIREELDSLGIAHRTICGTGVVADLPGSSDAPAVALRADIDALPIREETGLPFASEHDGLMHACGHDAHTSMLLGAAQLLAGQRALEVPVRLIFQPAEEVGCGAEKLVEAGALDGVGMIFGGHIDPRFPTGSLLLTPGTVNASTDTFHITVSGRGGHAGRPHEAIDAIVLGSQIVTALQAIVSRQVNPDDPSVISVTMFHAGTAVNAIAEQAVLSGTVRAHDEAVRAHLKDSMGRIAGSIADSHDATAVVEIEEGSPAVVNSPEMLELAREAALETVPEERVTRLPQANMGGEDFGYYLQTVPGCYIRFGARQAGREFFSAHSSRFDVDEEALAFGAAWYHRIAQRAARAIISS
jgi:hippurate hydrolase